MVGLARWRLASLWLSQVARVWADRALLAFVVLQLVGTDGWKADEAWQLVTALFVLPAIFLAPLNGAISNSLPKPLVLRASAAYCFAIVLLFGLLGGPWVACWGLLALGAAVYGPTRYALLPTASQDGRVPLTRVNGWIEMGAMAAIVAGFVMGARWHGTMFGSWDTVVLLCVSLSLLAFVTTLPVRFAGDTRRPEPMIRALAGFFRDCGRVWRIPQARGCLLGLAALRGLITAFMGAIIGMALSGPDTLVDELIAVGAWVLGGAALGSYLAGLQPHPTRVVGLVPLGATGLGIGLLICAASGVPGPTLCVVLGVMCGLINVPLAATYQAALPADARGNGMALRNFADYLLAAAAALGMYALPHGDVLSAAGQLWLLALIALVAAVVSWWLTLRDVLELMVEFLAWPMYRIRAKGPGLVDCPRRGPLLVIANHSSWLDPVWVAKVLPRRVIPMMTSVFYDLPLLRPLMKLGGVIRVQASSFRRDVPELRETVAALDRGEGVLLFPEGWMRRREDLPLRQFGQGIARLLKERPNTPVLVCWIEGGWGSFFSHRDGPPAKNKRLDFRRPIRIGVQAPRVIDPALIADQRGLRALLMQACLEARQLLGLEPLPLKKADDTEPADEGPEAQPKHG